MARPTERIGLIVQPTGVEILGGRSVVPTQEEEVRFRVGDQALQAWAATVGPRTSTLEVQQAPQTVDTGRKRRGFPVISLPRRSKKQKKATTNWGSVWDEAMAA